MNKFGREVTIEILVGMFMFVVLIALGIFTIVLSRENFLKTTYSYEFVFTEVSGLREGDNVYLRGMNVGRVQQTVLEEQNVVVHVTLDVPIELRYGYRIEIVNASMLGGKLMKIYEGPDAAQPIGQKGVTIFGTKPVDVIEELGIAVNGIQAMIDAVAEGEGTLGKLLHDDTMYENMAAVTEDFRTIVDRLEQGEGTLGHLLSADDTLYRDFAKTVASLQTVAEDLEGGKGTFGKLLREEVVYEDLKGLLDTLREVSEKVAAGEGTLGKLVSGESTAYDDFQASMAALRRVAESIEDGGGTIGKLIRDETLYDESTLLIEDVRAAVDDLREASPITSFGSVLFGAF